MQHKDKSLELLTLYLTAVPGKGQVVTVYAHTRPTWPWYAGGALAALLLLALIATATTALYRRRRRSTAAPAGA